MRLENVVRQLGLLGQYKRNITPDVGLKRLAEIGDCFTTILRDMGQNPEPELTPPEMMIIQEIVKEFELVNTYFADTWFDSLAGKTLEQFEIAVLKLGS